MCQSIHRLTNRITQTVSYHIFLSQTSDAITLDLMTYSDLESLRNMKTGGEDQKKATQIASSQLNNKRYLIMTYTVEFDR